MNRGSVPVIEIGWAKPDANKRYPRIEAVAYGSGSGTSARAQMAALVFVQLSLSNR